MNNVYVIGHDGEGICWGTDRREAQREARRLTKQDDISWPDIRSMTHRIPRENLRYWSFE